MADEIDGLLRDRFDQVFPSGPDPRQALASVHPLMRRARAIRRVGAGATGAMAVGLVALVGLVVLDRPQPSMEIMAAGPEATSATPLDPVVDPDLDDGGRSETGDEDSLSSSSVPTDAGTPGESVGSIPPRPQVPVPPGESEPTSTTMGVPNSSSTVSAAPTTTAAANPAVTVPSTTTVTGTETVASACGSVTVEVSDGDVVLLATSPDAGFEVDEKNDGPETVEVSFEGPEGHCEIKVEVRNGLLWTDVDNES